MHGKLRAYGDGVATDDKAWIEDVTGGSVTRFERLEGGSSRGTWLVDVDVAGDGAIRPLVLRRDTGDGPLSGTALSLARESQVYAALSGTGVAIPQLVARTDDADALLVERAPGTADGSLLDEDGKQRVALGYVDALATLHGLDADALDLPGFARPATPEKRALAELELWEGIFDDRVKNDAPTWRAAYRWLRAHLPATGDRTVVCHGDAGPGNYLFDLDRREITALLDWEFAHLGDPMDDIAWLTVRGHHISRFGDAATELARYSDVTGVKIDRERVRWYQALVLTRMATACLAALERPGGGMDHTTYQLLEPLLRRLVTPVLLELAGTHADDELHALRGAADKAVAAFPILEPFATDLAPLP
jgi:aminoglycoside phosphotransferase (APT) family kinase protein